MKRALFVLVSVVLAISVLCSCRVEYTDSYEPVCKFLHSYGVEAKVYYSLAKEEEEHYLDEGISKQLFTNTELLPQNYTVAMSARLDYVFEIGVFVVPSRSDVQFLRELCRERLQLLGSLSAGEGEILLSGNLLIYIFDRSPKDAVDVLKRVL